MELLVVTKFVLVVLCIAIPAIVAQNDVEQHNFLDIESPKTFAYSSPLQQKDSLRSRPYFDFLSTLYRHDNTKEQLFKPYLRTKRDAIAVAPEPLQQAIKQPVVSEEFRQKRAIVFRPLFVYRQQQVRRQQLSAARRRRY